MRSNLYLKEFTVQIEDFPNVSLLVIDIWANQVSVEKIIMHN